MSVGAKPSESSDKKDVGATNKEPSAEALEIVKEHLEEIVRNASAEEAVSHRISVGKASTSGASRTSDRVKIISPETDNRNLLQEMTNSELVNAVNELQRTTRYLELENGVFINFCQKNDPSLIEGMITVIQEAQSRQRASISRRTLTKRSSRKDSSVLWSGTSPASGSFSSQTPTILAEKEGPRININQKTDLILREMEEIRNSVQASSTKYGFLQHKLRAELEEMSIRESEVRETMETFENVFINGTVEKYTQTKNPAEKFARFMEEWFKNTRLAVDKIRLRTSSLKVQYQKICAQLTQKKLLGENLQEVDFEQLQISNKHLVTKIDQRNLLLLGLKKMNGKANLLLSQNKKVLLRKLGELQQIKDDIAFREEAIIKLDEECDKVSQELDATRDEYDKIKLKTETYEVPDVLDYVKMKAELGVLKKNLKIWARRKQIKDMALLACIREMKHITGSKTIDPSWLEQTNLTFGVNESIASSFNFTFDSNKPLKPNTLRRKNSKRMY